MKQYSLLHAGLLISLSVGMTFPAGGCGRRVPNKANASAGKLGPATSTEKPAAAESAVAKPVKVVAPTPSAPAEARTEPTGKPAAATGHVPQPGPTGAKAKGATDGKDGYGAAQAGAAVVSFVKLLNGGEVTLEDVSERDNLYVVSYHGEGAKPVKRTVWVTRDGRWVTTNLVDIETRTEHLRQFDKWMTCLGNKGLRVYLDPSEPKSQQQSQALGPLVKRVSIDCSGPRKKLCANLGFTAFPTFIWKGKSEVGFRDRKWIAATLACPLRLFDKIAAPTSVNADDLGRRLHKLHALASDAPMDLVSVRRDEATWVVVLSRGRVRPQSISLRISEDGVHILQAPIEMAKEIQKVRVRRAFVKCLTANKVRLFVSAKDDKSLRWLGSIAAEARGVAVDCASPAGKAMCAKAGIKKLPMAERAGTKLGPRITIEDLEALSGCKR